MALAIFLVMSKFVRLFFLPIFALATQAPDVEAQTSGRLYRQLLPEMRRQRAEVRKALRFYGQNYSRGAWRLNPNSISNRYVPPPFLSIEPAVFRIYPGEFRPGTWADSTRDSGQQFSRLNAFATSKFLGQRHVAFNQALDLVRVGGPGRGFMSAELSPWDFERIRELTSTQRFDLARSGKYYELGPGVHEAMFAALDVPGLNHRELAVHAVGSGLIANLPTRNPADLGIFKVYDRRKSIQGLFVIAEPRGNAIEVALIGAAVDPSMARLNEQLLEKGYLLPDEALRQIFRPRFDGYFLAPFSSLGLGL